MTAGAEIPPRAPVKVWWLVPLELAVAAVAIVVLVPMTLVAVAAGASVTVTVTVTVAAHSVAVSSATAVVVVAAALVVAATPGFPSPPMACKPHQYVDRTQEKASTYCKDFCLSRVGDEQVKSEDAALCVVLVIASIPLSGWVTDMTRGEGTRLDRI